MWKYYFNCDGPVVIEAGNLNEAHELCTQFYGCSPCEFLGCDPPGCAGDTGWRPDATFLAQAEARSRGQHRRAEK